MKIFLTGDNHIGLKYASHEQRITLASNRIEAFDGMVEAANREKCALFVIAGDLFENTYSVTKENIKALLGKLSCFRGTVIILPGNHDYYGRDVKLWKEFNTIMSQYDNIMLLTEYRTEEIVIGEEKVVIYPALCMSKHSEAGQNNLEWIKKMTIENDGSYHIGIAHGAVEGETIDSEEQYFLMKRSELDNIPLDAWLIGHTHVPFPRNLTESFSISGKIFNAGTHVQTDVSCNTEGQCFVIDIDKDKTIRAKKFLSGNLRFYRKNIVVTAGEMENIINQEFADIGDNSVVDIILTGAVTAEEYKSRTHIIEKSLSRFLEATYEDSELSILISSELIKSEFSETSFSAGLLNALIDEPKEAQLVYELLKSLKGDK